MKLQDFESIDNALAHNNYAEAMVMINTLLPPLSPLLILELEVKKKLVTTLISIAKNNDYFRQAMVTLIPILSCLVSNAEISDIQRAEEQVRKVVCTFIQSMLTQPTVLGAPNISTLIDVLLQLAQHPKFRIPAFELLGQMDFKLVASKPQILNMCKLVAHLEHAPATPRIILFIQQLDKTLSHQKRIGGNSNASGAQTQNDDHEIVKLAKIAVNNTKTNAQLRTHFEYCKQCLSDPNGDHTFAITFLKNAYNQHQQAFKAEYKTIFATTPHLLIHPELLLESKNAGQKNYTGFGAFFITEYADSQEGNILSLLQRAASNPQNYQVLRESFINLQKLCELFKRPRVSEESQPNKRFAMSSSSAVPIIHSPQAQIKAASPFPLLGYLDENLHFQKGSEYFQCYGAFAEALNNKFADYAYTAQDLAHIFEDYDNDIQIARRICQLHNVKIHWVDAIGITTTNPARLDHRLITANTMQPIPETFAHDAHTLHIVKDQALFIPIFPKTFQDDNRNNNANFRAK